MCWCASTARYLWNRLNRNIRSNCGFCAEILHKWKWLPPPVHDCGDDRQTLQHIVIDCQTRYLHLKEIFNNLNQRLD